MRGVGFAAGDLVGLVGRCDLGLHFGAAQGRLEIEDFIAFDGAFGEGGTGGQGEGDGQEDELRGFHDSSFGDDRLKTVERGGTWEAGLRRHGKNCRNRACRFPNA